MGGGSGSELLLLALLCILVLTLPSLACAAGNSPLPPGVCTDSPIFDPPPGSNKLLTVITDNFRTLLLSMAQGMYNGIISQSTFVGLISAIVTLYVVIYGILFTLGLAEITIYDFTIRLIKVCLVAALIQPWSWEFFAVRLSGIIIGGGNQLIAIMAGIGVGGITGLGSTGGMSAPSPFMAIDNVVSNITSAKMSATMIGVFLNSGPAGPLAAALIYGAAGIFIRALLQAIWVYIMAMAMLTILFGVAPIFIGCFLFSKTKYLFDGWLNQLVNAVLQPTLLFTFFAFFSALVSHTVMKILSTPWCWVSSGSVDGSSVPMKMWIPKINGMLAREEWDWQGSEVGGVNIHFPIDIMDIVAFIILAQICGKMGDIVLKIARNIAGASTSLDMSGVGGKIMQEFKSAAPSVKAAGAPVGAAAGARSKPGDKAAGD